ncbi:MAG TPA: hypothetical protein PKV41_00560 [Candidatus Omnitrophota bacterium]|nr:hypothetical protein [Candidatus Omnitrophota bacterium]
MAKVSLSSFDPTVASGDYQLAQRIAQGEIGARNTPQDLLWNLQSGALQRMLKDYASSNAYFERVENALRYYDQRNIAERSAKGVQGMLFNDSALPYTGRAQDRVMVNTYKALNYMALGDPKKARVEFNRAMHRQNQAKAYFSEQAQKARIELPQNEPSSDPDADTVTKTLNNPELERIINERYQSLNDIKIYSQFINSFTPYIAGLFFWLEGDHAKATDMLKEAYALNSAHPTIASDLARAARGETPRGGLWVIYEGGLAPRREEVRFDIPLISDDIPVKYIGIALPKLAEGEKAHASLSIAAGGQTVSTEPLADISNCVRAEFRRELPAITAREISRVILKTYFQYRLEYNYGFVAGLAGGLYQAATTAVDVRSWTALPDSFQAAHLKIPSDHRVTVTAPEGETTEINIPPECKNVILYIRIVASKATPVIDLIKF